MVLRILLTLILIAPSYCFAQKDSIKFYDFNLKGGFPITGFKSLCQDSYGFIWMASDEGLLCWDGFRLRRYTHSNNDARSIGDNIVYTVFEDSKGRVWVGTIDGLSLYNRQLDNFIKCPLVNRNQRIPVNAIIEDRNNKLWLATSLGLCNYNFDEKRVLWILSPDQDKHVLFSLTVDDSNNLWAGSFENGILKYDQNENVFKWFDSEPENKASLKRRRINTILYSSDKKIWAGIEINGLTVLDTTGNIIERKKIFSGTNIYDNSVRSLYEDKTGIIWIGVRRQPLFYKSPYSNEIKEIKNSTQNNPYNTPASIGAITEDSFGNIWFGSISSDLYYTNSSKNVFSNFLQSTSFPYGLKSNIITSFCEKPGSKDLWIGTDGGGLLRFDIATGQIHIVKGQELSNAPINDIKADSDGRLWLGTWGNGLVAFDPRTGTGRSFKTIPGSDYLVNANIKTILPYNDLILIGTHGDGLFAYDKVNNKFINSGNNNVFPFNMREPSWINHLFKDSKGRLWIGTYNGVYRFNGKKLEDFVHIKNDSTSLLGNSVNMIAEDTEGRIWIAGETGLDQLDENNNRFIHFNKSLPDAVKSIIMGKDGLLWMGTNEGIFSIAISDYKVAKYNENDGIFSKAFFQKAVYASADGKLYFGSKKGFCSFNPLQIRRVDIPYYFHFTDLYINNKLQRPGNGHSVLTNTLDFTNTIVLSQQQSFFSVGFTIVNLVAPEKMRYQYLLSGLLKDWVDIKDEQKIAFSKLPHGRYALRIKYSNGDGNWHEVPRRLTIVVLPYWWQTIWFRIVSVVMTIALITLIFYLRLAAVKKRNRQLTGEVRKRTEELNRVNTSLTKQNIEIKARTEELEISNREIQRQSQKIIEQQGQITEQNHKLEGIVEALKKSNNTKDRFFSILAHDLKNPVAALSEITSFVKQNINRMERNKLQEYISDMNEASYSVYELLVNLLNWSRTQSKTLVHKPESWSLMRLVQQNARLLEPQLNNKNIHLEVSVDPSHAVFADYNMIDTVLRNIITNSIKFTEYNGNVKIVSFAAGDKIFLDITDTGIGIKKQYLKKLFSLDKEYLTDGTAGEKGTGLGLVICKEFVQINSGTIAVTSEYKKGTTFTIGLPKSDLIPETQAYPGELAEKEQVMEVDYWETLSTEKVLRVKGRKILIVDDNKEVRDYLKLQLEGKFVIAEAGNGVEAFELILSAPPDIVITDLLMPEMNGRQLCDKIKTTGAVSHIPVVILTSQFEERAKIEGYKAGADIYLTKPVKRDILIQVCVNLLLNTEARHDVLIKQMLTESPVDLNAFGKSKADKEFLSAFVKVVEDNTGNHELDAAFICRQLAISRTVLYSRIKMLTGQSVNELIKMMRVKQSLYLLLEGKASINQVAYEVGFNSASYYHRCFVKLYGISPKEYVTQKSQYLKR